VSPFKIRGRNKRVSLSRICWRDQKDAKSSQKSGCYCNGFHGFLLRWVSEILMTHGRLPGGAPSVRGFEKSCLAPPPGPEGHPEILPIYADANSKRINGEYWPPYDLPIQYNRL